MEEDENEWFRISSGVGQGCMCEWETEVCESGGGENESEIFSRVERMFCWEWMIWYSCGFRKRILE